MMNLIFLGESRNMQKKPLSESCRKAVLSMIYFVSGPVSNRGNSTEVMIERFNSLGWHALIVVAISVARKEQLYWLDIDGLTW